VPHGNFCALVDATAEDLSLGPDDVRVRRHAQDMDMAGADLDHEEHVQAAQGHRAVDMEEVAREHHRRGLKAQELPPRRAAALRRGRYPRPGSAGTPTRVLPRYLPD
jgi:hypothetical protein